MVGYYDIDDIITEEEPVSVIFQEAVNGVGIDPSSEQNYVEQVSKVELPFWLASELRRRNVVVAHAPGCFNQKTRVELPVDPAL
ncbi:hypothetical protein SAY87_018931 [Trapa incisa]|uniref:DNA replication complex GINS protein PSF3 N-terminal domain-containing protein n=1 Tax=Trapa incisa TaxID=236973 RepID=A0AAN7K5X0_9MYRT|nr:hypothetical protein SAY87_018931 [Trapa incisa]